MKPRNLMSLALLSAALGGNVGFDRYDPKARIQTQDDLDRIDRAKQKRARKFAAKNRKI